MAVLPTIKVRTKIVLVVAHLDHGNRSKEESQFTLRYNLNDLLSDAEYATLIGVLKSGSLSSNMGPQ